MPFAPSAAPLPDAPADAAHTATPLRDAVLLAFGAAGPLAAADAEFCQRPGQTTLALAVADTIAQGGALVAEAATGVGKTFAYLAPALLSGERVLLSTATKALQDQLFARDLPRLRDILQVPVRVALLKGRASYVCLHRLELARQSTEADTPADRHTLAKIERWTTSTRTGDLAELPGLDERSPIVPLVTSTRENCLGSECPQFRACHVQLARRDALAADVVVINHHLFFADLAVRESGMAELLPSTRVVVFDEAHQLNETGTQFLGQQLGSSQLLDLARDMLAAGLRHARGLRDWPELAAAVELGARELRLAGGPAPPSGERLQWQGPTPAGVEPAEWAKALTQTRLALQQAAEAVGAVQDLSPDFKRLQERIHTLLQRAQGFAQPCPEDWVRWVDIGQGIRLIESPLDIAQVVRERLLTAPAQPAAPPPDAEDDGHNALPWPDDEAPPPGPPRAWVFVSATLGDDPALRWFTQPCGLEQARVLRIGSPFDYAHQASLYVPAHIASPSAPGHSADVARLAAEAAQQLGGRTLVLTTTLRALRAISAALKEQLPPGIEVLAQGEWPKRVLMERFRQGNAAGGAGCVLVAAASFWEGVDVPGDALQCVVIDKLPFPPPGDPLVQARCQRLERQGRSPFADYSLPEAAVALKQGAGRLIRRETDRGVLLIGDTRLLRMGYGRRLLAALPPMRRLHSPADWALALAELRATHNQTHDSQHQHHP